MVLPFLVGRSNCQIKTWVIRNIIDSKEKNEWPHGQVPKSKQIDLGSQDRGMP